MSETERRWLVGVVIAAAIVSILLFVDMPLYNDAQRLERRSAEEQQRLTSVVALSEEYRSVKAELDQIRETAFTGGTALSAIDTIVGKGGLKRKMTSVKSAVKPVAEGIKAIKAELSFEGISLGNLSGLLAALESDGHPLAIERVSIRATYEDPSAFNATLIVNTVERE